MPLPDEHDDDAGRAAQKTPGGPYFGRLVIVLALAIAFCGVLTWALGHFVAG